MIRLTRLNHQPLAVNSDLIKFVEQTHDTVLTLINGDKVVVRENVDQVLERIIQFRHSILAGPGPTGSNAAATALAVLSAGKQAGTDR